LRRIFYEDVNDKILYMSIHITFQLNWKIFNKSISILKTRTGMTRHSWRRKKVTVALHLKKSPLYREDVQSIIRVWCYNMAKILQKYVEE
jgi:predicted nucleotide-binding protein (sugar kinase/HSP70/actin superfamily)